MNSSFYFQRWTRADNWITRKFNFYVHLRQYKIISVDIVLCFFLNSYIYTSHFSQVVDRTFDSQTEGSVFDLNDTIKSYECPVHTGNLIIANQCALNPNPVLCIIVFNWSWLKFVSHLSCTSYLLYISSVHLWTNLIQIKCNIIRINNFPFYPYCHIPIVNNKWL